MAAAGSTSRKTNPKVRFAENGATRLTRTASRTGYRADPSAGMVRVAEDQIGRFDGRQFPLWVLWGFRGWWHVIQAVGWDRCPERRAMFAGDRCAPLPDVRSGRNSRYAMCGTGPAAHSVSSVPFVASASHAHPIMRIVVRWQGNCTWKFCRNLGIIRARQSSNIAAKTPKSRLILPDLAGNRPAKCTSGVQVRLPCIRSDTSSRTPSGSINPPPMKSNLTNGFLTDRSHSRWIAKPRNSSPLLSKSSLNVPTRRLFPKHRERDRKWYFPPSSDAAHGPSCPRSSSPYAGFRQAIGCRRGACTFPSAQNRPPGVRG